MNNTLKNILAASCGLIPLATVLYVTTNSEPRQISCDVEMIGEPFANGYNSPSYPLLALCEFESEEGERLELIIRNLNEGTAEVYVEDSGRNSVAHRTYYHEGEYEISGRVLGPNEVEPFDGRFQIDDEGALYFEASR